MTTFADTSSTKNDNETTHDTAPADVQRSLDGSGAPSLRNQEVNELCTNGVPDANKIKRRMEQLAHEYVNKRFQVITTGRFRFQREIILRKQVEREFYSAMWRLEDLLYAVPVLPLQAESTTTIVPYEPAKRRRGRPATGVKPRDRRVAKDDDPY